MADFTDSEVFLAFSTYATIVILKMMFMSPLTAYFRITRKAFANIEDTQMGKTPDEKKKMLRVNEDVERVRRCHQNDIENVIPFVLVGFLYTLTGPELSTALLLFRLFVGSRFVHSFVYVMAWPQPSRGLSFFVGLCATVCMAYHVLAAGLRL
ncbi:microsomal glutathione S-transferase 1 [Clarias magur]|uniref:Microsomal glutathione S-transferase 1 n=2 Tax=Clarias TaxID=13012 RepID=A0A8J4U9T1_CLAMG|nr:microsomal glutathione S-transferase 1 [Clarias magur]BAU71517.1 microsomal glutathione S-transferase 1 [Clarias batrachus]